MEFTRVIEDVKRSKLAGRRYEKSGHSKFRDCVTVCRNGRLRFQRYCYGEAASLVCTLWADAPAGDEAIAWDFSASDYSGKEEAPATLTGYEEKALLFDDKQAKWEPDTDYKSLPEAGLSGLKMLFSR